MALYIASDRPLPLTKQPEYVKGCTSSPTWPKEAQRFHTAALKPTQEAVRSHFSHPHVLYAGSYERCGCGFNYGREYPESQDDTEHLTAARESVAELVRYVRASGVREIYSCWFDDEAKPTVRQRTITPEALGSPDFIFGKQELLRIEHAANDRSAAERHSNPWLNPPGEVFEVVPLVFSFSFLSLTEPCASRQLTRALARPRVAA